MVDTSLRITEIFYSLQGESLTVGVPTVFVRLTGCPLRCQYCDSEYAFHGGTRLSIDEILAKVDSYNAKTVCVTGGEPLAQPDCLVLLTALCDRGYRVSLETSGALSIADVDTRVSRVVDLKTPGSGEVSKNLYANIDYLTKHDQIKFVLCDRQDYDWACFKIAEYDLTQKAHVFMSPSFGQINPTELADWIVNDNLDVRFQLQLHKILWGDKPGK
ncbi:7-carboxy-7-deazaguanine synthase QueE [Sessilibacter sp. MAH4]